MLDCGSNVRLRMQSPIRRCNRPAVAAEFLHNRRIRNDSEPEAAPERNGSTGVDEAHCWEAA
jgi:hypothetical protein